jgi:hypothetical protein
MQVHSSLEGGMLHLTVSLYNDNTGHKIPTDSPLRQMLLIIEVIDSQGIHLEQLEGPILPEWAGLGEPNDGYYAGLPGKAYALLLQELWTEISPSGAYWNPTRVVEDTRLEPFEEDFTSYLFDFPENKEVSVRVRLVLRRAFIELMDQKGWSDPDILMAERVISLPSR